MRARHELHAARGCATCGAEVAEMDKRDKYVVLFATKSFASLLTLSVSVP